MVVGGVEPLRMAPSMAPQLHLGPFNMGNISRVENIDWVKPKGGLWMSTFDPEIGSEWVRWTEEEMSDWGSDVGVLCVVRPDARILEVDQREDLRRLIQKYPGAKSPVGENTFLDFEKIAEDYDGIHITKRGAHILNTIQIDPNLDGWNVESTLFFRDVFSSCKTEEMYRLVAQS